MIDQEAIERFVKSYAIFKLRTALNALREGDADKAEKILEDALKLPIFNTERKLL